ncbi:unnamed protein product [Calypogeia fissa]
MALGILTGFLQRQRMQVHWSAHEQRRLCVDARKTAHFVVPDLTDFELKAYVAHDTPKVPKIENTSSSAGEASSATS